MAGNARNIDRPDRTPIELNLHSVRAKAPQKTRYPRAHRYLGNILGIYLKIYGHRANIKRFET
ncbi:hypothetical protein QUB10_15895 [Microcoleus sp. B5-D4]|uniref:hypothetical protein n=1 Tax=Microcoleus sp. B5-C4 TaxID=2818675 RepID=UPI002FCFB52C